MIQPVTNPAQRTTDPLVLTALNKQGISPDYVEFCDYTADSPTTKTYVDRMSGQRIAVCSNLPMVRPDDGSKVRPGWDSSASGYYTRNNLFDGEVTLDCIRLTPVVDQPDIRRGDEIDWSPTLMIGSEVVLPRSMSVLDVDPVNDNYTNNVVEIDYGVCKRRVRLIEGRVIGTWVFDADPGADVTIRYTSETGYKCRIGSGKSPMGMITVENPDDMTEVVRADQFGALPVTIRDTAIFYPDGDPESSTVDGFVSAWVNAGSDLDARWYTLFRQVTGYATDYMTQLYCGLLNSGTGVGTDKNWTGYRSLIRTYKNVAGTITAGSLSLYCYSTDVGVAGAQFVVTPTNLYGYNSLTSNGSYSMGDDYYRTGIYGDTALTSPFTAPSTGSYHECVFNGDGIDYLKSTNESEYAVRLYGDYTATRITDWGLDKNALIYWYAAEQGAGYKPKLTITYTPPITPLTMNLYRQMRG